MLGNHGPARQPEGLAMWTFHTWVGVGLLGCALWSLNNAPSDQELGLLCEDTNEAL